MIFALYSGVSMACWPILPSWSGDLPYTTADLEKELNSDSYMLQVELSDVASLLVRQTPFSALRKAVPGQKRIIYSRSTDEGASTTSAQGLVVEAISGRAKLSVEDYMDIAAREKPDILVAMAHEVPHGSKSKRVKQSEECTKLWQSKRELYGRKADAWSPPQEFKVILTSQDEDDTISRAVAYVESHGEEGGISMGNVALPGGSDRDGSIGLLRKVRQAVGPTLAIFMPRMNTLELILGAIEAGATYISTQVSVTMTKNGVAALWVPLLEDGETESSSSSSGGAEVINSAAQRELDEWHARRAGTASAPLYLNVNDGIQRDNTQPLCPGCKCHACRRHTRAYVHHLSMANELLGCLLLYTHNQWQVVQLFAEARRRLAQGENITSWLQTFRDRM